MWYLIVSIPDLCTITYFYTKLNVWGSLGLNLIMRVPSLKMVVPSFYISFEFWKVVHPSVKGFEQALAVKQVSQFVSKRIVSIGIYDLFGAGF